MKTDYEKFRDASPENAALLKKEEQELAHEEIVIQLREAVARLREALNNLESEIKSNED